MTRKQYELLVYIDQQLRTTGVSPSFDEMKDALGLKSKSGIHRLITGLEERGFIRRLPHRARAIEILRLPDNMAVSGPKAKSRGKGFALNVIEGDSMTDAGIYDGDTVIIRRSDTAENNSIVVALIEKTEVTLKRLRRKGASIALEPANKAFETRIFGPDQVKVQGCLVGLIRKY